MGVEPLYRAVYVDPLGVVGRSAPDEGAAVVAITLKGYEIAIDSGGWVVVR